jgi:hypothetical protein
MDEVCSFISDNRIIDEDAEICEYIMENDDIGNSSIPEYVISQLINRIGNDISDSSYSADELVSFKYKDRYCELSLYHGSRGYSYWYIRMLPI